MKFFKEIPTINAYDTESYQNNLKVICDAYGNYYEPSGNPDALLEWLFKTGCDLNFLYNIDYDTAILFRAIMPDVDTEDNGKYHYKNYDIYYISNKSLIIKRHDSKTRTVILRLYDIAQFYKNERGYQSLDKVSKEVLGIGKNQEELEIKREDIGQIEGYYESHRDRIIEYCINDSYLTLQLAKRKIESIIPVLNGQIPKTYNSSASISKAYLSIYHPYLRYSYYRLISKLGDNYKDAIRLIENSYFGGIFYLHSLGKVSDLYEYDINSAYPYAITQLFSLNNAEIRYTNKYEKADYSFYKVKIRNMSDLPIHYRTADAEITYIRSNDYVENYFTGIELEYFTKYHSKDIQFEILEGIVINTTKQKEFEDFNELYDKRNEIKRKVKEKKEIEKISGIRLNSLDDDMSQWSYKTVLNASYGCFAERKNGYTAFTNMIYAGYITAITRLRIYQIIDRVGFKHIKAVMTDAVLTDVEIKDNDFNSNELGSFKLEGHFDVVWLFMNGIYVSKIGNKISLHNRGFPSLTDVNLLFNGKGKKIKIVRDMKLIKTKEGIIQHKQEDIGKFTTQTKYLNLEANRWRYLIDVSKLNFEYLIDNELMTDYLFNIDLQFEFLEKPKLKTIDYKAFKEVLYISENWDIKPIEKYQIKKIDYETELKKIENGKNTKRDLKRFFERYRNRLDTSFALVDNNSQKYRLTVNDIERDTTIQITDDLIFFIASI